MTFACSPRPCGGCDTCWGGGRSKSQNRKNVYLSPYVEEPLNSKVIKSFVPELRSREYFRVSGFLCSTYICYEHSMYVSHIRIMGMVHIYIYIYIYKDSLSEQNFKKHIYFEF